MGVATILKAGGGTDTSDANATAEYILEGYTGYVSDKLVTGTMPDNGILTVTLNCGESYTIPKGLCRGGTITANSLASQTPGNAVPEYVLENKTLWVNGVKITGTMPNRGAVSYVMPANGSYTIAKGYHNGQGKITQSLATQGGWTVTPGTANILACASGRWVTGAIICAGSGNLVPWNIKKGVTIFGVTGTWQGF